MEDELVHEAILARAAATNPDDAAKVKELVEIRALKISIANIAAAEIREALG
jgi:hypothetical protein